MATFADGGVVGSKPYAASGNHIDRMSDFCASCRFVVKQKSGENTCPFNYLYWNFMIEHRDRLKGNQRLNYVYKTLERMDDERLRTIRRDTERFLGRLEPWDNPASDAAA